MNPSTIFHCKMIPLLLTILSCLPFFSSSNNNINHWCNTMPHPRPCQHYLAQTSHNNLHNPVDKLKFFKLSLQLTFNLSARAASHLKGQGVSCSNNHERQAWLDCCMLYDNTVFQLKRALNTLQANCIAFDAQTWLSAALTNLDTCIESLKDTKSSTKIIKPILQYNISELISNLLAVNKQANEMEIMNYDFELLQSATNFQANLVVAKDGSGHYYTINEALDEASKLIKRNKYYRFVIYIKSGVYNEYLQVSTNIINLTMVGDGIGKTIITGRRSAANGFTTFSSPTFGVFGDGFIAQHITFRNTYGPGSQAVAMLSGSDRSVYYRCSFEGYQDTLCVFTQRQFYRECKIYGTIDFIFGNAATVLQNCSIYARLPLPGESNVVTAQGRTDVNQNSGIVIQFSTIGPADDLRPHRRNVKSYLGRPWRKFSRTLYSENYMDSIIDLAGWLAYDGDFGLSTLYYAEYGNVGPGAKVLSKRVKWPGFHVIKKASLVKQFSVGRFIDGRLWIPATGVPFYPTF